MTLTTYAPFDVQVDRLFSDAVRSLGKRASTWVPACNAWEEAERFFLELTLPGWRSQEVSLAVENGVLTVEGVREDKEETDVKKNRKYHIREGETGSFKRSFRLPEDLDQEKAHASFKDGILTIEFPKREEAKPRRIMIQ